MIFLQALFQYISLFGGFRFCVLCRLSQALAGKIEMLKRRRPFMRSIFVSILILQAG